MRLRLLGVSIRVTLRVRIRVIFLEVIFTIELIFLWGVAGLYHNHHDGVEESVTQEPNHLYENKMSLVYNVAVR